MTASCRSMGSIAAGRVARALLLAGVILCGGLHRLDAQSVPRQYGRHFLVAFPDTIRAYIRDYVSATREDVAFIMMSDAPAKVTITAPGLSTQVTVDPAAARTVWLSDLGTPGLRPYVDVINTPQNNVFSITSDVPIGLTCYFTTHNGSEAFVPLPVDAWGTDYHALALSTDFIFDLGRIEMNEEGTDYTDTPGQVLVIASEDSTDVRVQSPIDLYISTFKWTRDTTFRLNAGQAVLVQAYHYFRDPSFPDITGTHVTANKPVGVVSGTTRTHGGVGAFATQTATGNASCNAVAEWLEPADHQGTTFVVRPFGVVGATKIEELIRVVATSPGVTVVRPSNGFAPAILQQGEVAAYSYSLDNTVRGAFTLPFAITTDKPAAAMIVTGSFSRAVSNQAEGELTLETWSPAMSLLPPREAWFNAGRYHAPEFPDFLKHYVIIAADSGSSVSIDGTRVAFDPVPVDGTPFRHLRMEVAAGDHTIQCTGGRCGAIAYGESKGFESFAPIGTRRKDDGARPAAAPHPTKYSEEVSIAYAFPIAGILSDSTTRDSVVFDRVDRCDSTVVTLARLGPTWSFVPYTIVLAPGAVNIDTQIVQIWNSTTAGYRIRLRPADPTRDADAVVIITSAMGQRWEIPFSYRVQVLAVTPDPLAILDVPIDVEQLLVTTLTNQRPFVATPIGIRLRNGGNGFSLRDISAVGVPLRTGEHSQITIAFTGSARNTEYHDTLEITTDCGTYLVPIRARTGPYPVPAITGKDWRERLVGTRHDSLSFVSNGGSVAYVPAAITITGDAAGAFALVAPDWHRIASVGPAGLDSLGISFLPPAAGPFTATIEMVTADGDTARAALRGIGIMPTIAAPDVVLGRICLEGTTDTIALFINTGTAPLTIEHLDASGTSATVTIDSSSIPPPFLPHVLAPGDTLRVPVRIAPSAKGAFTAGVTASSDAFLGDSVVTLAGTVATCLHPQLTIDDHDFDSVFITLTRQGTITIRNLGAGDAEVLSMTLSGDTASAFAIISPAPPFTVKDGESVPVLCSFTPQSIGLKTANVDVVTDIEPLVGHLRGVGKKLTIPALIRRDYHAAPGEETTIRVELGGRLDTFPVRQLGITVGFRHELLGFLAAEPDSGAKHGWHTDVHVAGDQLTATIDVNGAPPDTGSLLSMRFLTGIDILDRSELPLAITTGLPYVDVEPHPGLFQRDPFCGLLQRLYTLSPTNFRLDQIIPHPLRGEGTIRFEIPFDNYTVLAVYNALGAETARLVDAPLTAGVYVATVTANTLPQGLYYYKLISGPFIATRKMVVEE